MKEAVSWPDAFASLQEHMMDKGIKAYNFCKKGISIKSQIRVEMVGSIM